MQHLAAYFVIKATLTNWQYPWPVHWCPGWPIGILLECPFYGQPMQRCNKTKWLYMDRSTLVFEQREGRGGRSSTQAMAELYLWIERTTNLSMSYTVIPQNYWHSSAHLRLYLGIYSRRLRCLHTFGNCAYRAGHPTLHLHTTTYGNN